MLHLVVFRAIYKLDNEIVTYITPNNLIEVENTENR